MLCNMVHRRHSERQGGFTIIELLISIGALSILAVTVIVALNTRKGLLAARDAQRVMNARQVQNAMFQYLIDHSRLPVAEALGEGIENAKQICTKDLSVEECAAQGKVSLSDLPPELLAALPVDPLERCEGLTGYKAYTMSGKPRVFAAYLGLLLDEEVTPDCE